MVECKLCGKKCKNNRALWSHLYHHHYEYSLNHGKLYYDTFLIPEKFDKKCPFCEEEKNFRSLSYGYSIGCRKHYLKVAQLIGSKKRKENGNYASKNKGKKLSEQARQNIKAGRKKFLNSERGKIWKKATSKRQKGKNNSCHKMSEETKRAANLKISKKMKKNIQEGLFTPCIKNKLF